MTFIKKARKFLEPLKSSPKYLILSSIKFTFWAIYALYSVFLLKNTTQAIDAKDYLAFHENVIVFIYFLAFYFIGNYIGRRWEWPTLYYFTEKYISDVYVRKIMMIDNNYMESIGTGKMISVMTVGIKRWNELLSFLIRDASRSVIVFIVTFYVIISMNTIYGLLFVVVVLLVHLIVAWIDGFARGFRKIRTEKRHEYSRKLVQIVMSKIEILQNNKTQEKADELRSIHEQIEHADDKVSYSVFFLFNIPRLFLALVRIGILYFIGYATFTGEFTITDFTLAMTLLLLFETFMLDSVEFFKNFTKDFSDIESLWKTIDTAPTMRGYFDGKNFTPQDKMDIEINNVTYTYGNSPVFQDFSLTLEQGKKIALVGASGGGKTTLLKLIAGYLHPESGTISVLGNTLSETALKTYYPHIGYLTQEPSVFDATIRENLLSALPVISSREDSRSRNDKNKEADTEIKLQEALRLAKCDFVFDLEKGLDTEIGERGVRLSGGQKQRLAIAKIFLKNPEIILLDEPTSALDSFSEEAITEALHTLFEGRTVIIIAHRLQTVRHADDIIVIEGGKVVERGVHDTLSNSGGIYARMLELQSGF